MNKLLNSNFKLGMISGGQLGKMLIQEASKWDIISYVMDTTPVCPAGGVANVFVQGSLFNFDDVYNFGKQLDLLTYEIEHINIEALKKLKAEGIKILPDPEALELIQDKGLQKNFYRDNGIPTSAYTLYESVAQIKEALDTGLLQYPFVQKLRKGGYDGRGVAVLQNAQDAHQLLDGPSVVEELVDIDKELAVIAARNEKGEVACFPAVEMVFDPKANLVERLICPSYVSDEIKDEAAALASKIIENMNIAGLLAVEFFVDKQGRLLVNEVAPRPHNSGHHTIESVLTSQYEQHLRAILNLPLGKTTLLKPAVMLNLLGEEGHSGPVYYEGFKEALAYEGVKVHLYGKKETRPSRKMGHVTILGDTLQKTEETADIVKTLIKVKSWDKNR